MWNSNINLTPLTIDSIKTSRKRRLERHRRGNKFLNTRIPESIGPTKCSPDPRFKNGSCLPITKITTELVNVPLEDVDPFYADKETFVTVTETKILYRFSVQNALNIFSPLQLGRRACISVLHNWIYRWFMILTVFMDCCLLTQPKIYDQLIVHIFFGVIYTFDFVANEIARGLVLDQFTFLRDGWGKLDLLLLVPYYIPYIGRHHFLSGLRLSKIAALLPSLKSMVNVLWKTVVDLKDMFLWSSFATWIFALVGYHSYIDVSSQKCVLDFPEHGSEHHDLNWHDWISNSTHWWNVQNKYILCGNDSVECFEGFTCLQIPHQDDRLYSSMGWALLSTIRVMLQDSWYEAFYYIFRLKGPWHSLYFVATLFLGSFYTLNMILAVVLKSCDNLQKELKLAKKLEGTTSNVCWSNRGDVEVKGNHDDNIQNDNGNAESSILIKYLDCKGPIKNIWTWYTNRLNMVAFHPITELIMAIITIGNLMFFAMDHFGVEENRPLHRILVSGYQVFGTMFAVECLLKFLACGPFCYFKSKWNIFDLLQTIVFLVESKFEVNTGWMKALLSLRSLRIFKLARIWPTLGSMLNGVFRAMENVSDMTFVAIGIFYMYCVAGMNLFGETIGTRHPKSHWHFRDFSHSLMVIFRLLCGDWVDSMLECFDDHGWTCIPFFFSAFVVLDLTVMNLLLVMFLQRFSVRNLSKSSQRKTDTNKVVAFNRFKRLGIWIQVKFGASLPQREKSNNVHPHTPFQEEQNIEVGVAIRSSSHDFRKIFQTLMNNKWFKYFNIGNTIIATIGLSLRDVHLESRPLLKDTLIVVEDLTLFLMVVEAVIKIVAMGFSDFIKNKWNRLDLIIVLSGTLNLIRSLILGINALTFFRSMRVLRLFSHFEGLRIIFNSLERAMRKIFATSIACLLIWLLWAIIGVQLLKGRFYVCVDFLKLGPEIEFDFSADLLGTKSKEECLKSGFLWLPIPKNFDNVGSAFFRVLEIITFKGWTGVFDLATSYGDDEPSFEKNFWIAGYFVAVVLFGSFFAFNLFSGVLIDALNEEKENITGEASNLLKENCYHASRKYMLNKLTIKLSSSRIQTSKYQKFISGVTSKYVGIVLFLNLLFNMILLTIQQGSTNMVPRNVLVVLNLVCTTVFASECLLNMFALKWRFSRNPCRMFELVTELLSIFEILCTDVLLKTSYVPFHPGLLRLVRFTYSSNYLRHFKAADGLRKLMSVLQISLLPFFNICLLFFLVVFIYALFGMELFKSIEPLLANIFGVNFGTLPAALISLFPLITTADWDRFIVFIFDKAFCELKDSWLCGNTTVGGVYVISFMFITFVIFVNMICAVILESYSRASKLVECELRDEHFEMFYEVLSQFKTENSKFVNYTDLADVFERFESPLKVTKPNRCAITIMNLTVYRGNLVHCADVLDAAITCLYVRKGVIPAQYFSQYHDDMKNRKECKKEMISSTYQLQRELRCVKIIQRAWRNHKKFLNK